MFKKGLITLVCLTVMSALWSWAATTYSISTKINSLGTTASVVDGKTVYTPIVGGSIQVRDNAAHSTGIKYTNLTTSALVDVVVTPAAGYKVSALTKNGAAQPLAANQTAPVTVQVQKPSPIATQFVVATFAVAGDTAVVSKTWQLQLQNNNGGGKINYTRAGVSNDYTAIGKLFAKNYIDTTPVTVTVTPSTGYNIDYLVVNGVKTFYGTDAAQVVNVDPAVGSRLKSVVAGYKKKSALVTTANTANGGGIAPLNPVADPYGNVRLVISPTGSSNVVTSVTATGGTVTLTDRFGDPVTLPYIGAVKATITGITGPITVSATYGFDAANSGQYSGCTQTCHLNASVPQTVRDADTQWLGSAHRTQNVDCVSCHQTMPGPDFSTAAAKDTLCASCHTTRNQHTAAANQCSVCHTFSGGHDPAAALNAGVAPQHFGGAYGGAAQYVTQSITCANCHVAGVAKEIMVEWAESGHADVTKGPWQASASHDWPVYSGGSCKRCHTGIGFVDSVAGTTTVQTAAQPGQVLSCTTCHSDLATGAVRTLAGGSYTLPYQIPGTDAAADVIAVAGQSQICLPCHAGRGSGASLTAANAAAFNGRFPQHYFNAGASLFSASGYHFAGQSYTTGYHKNIGGNGPCVTCHMNDASAGKGHTFEAVTKTDGVVTAINTAAKCAACHTDMTAEKLVASKTAFLAALDTLKAALETKEGAFYNVADGGFYTAADFLTKKTVWSSVNALGAANNYWLFEHAEPAAYVHNRGYAMKLIADSVDFLNNGVIDGDSGVAASASHIAVSTADSTSCTSCHNGAATLATPHDGAFSTDCVSCHNNAGSVVKPAAAKTMATVHAVTGQVEVSNVSVTTDGTNVTMNFNVKVDGVAADNFTFTPGGYHHNAPTTPSLSPKSIAASGIQPAYTYAVKNDFVRTSKAPTVVSNGAGNYTATWTGVPVTGNVTFLANVFNAASGTRLEATAVGHLNAAARNLVTNASCVKCHGNNVFKAVGGHKGANPQGVEACVVCHVRHDSTSRGAGGDRLTSYVHGVHNSHNMPAGGYDRQFPVKDGVIDFEIGYPTYMTNCSVCHETPAQLAAVNAAPVSYSLCLSCHDTWEGFDHGNTVFGGQEHNTFDWNTDCSSCHDGATARNTAEKFHNGLMTERSGLIYGGQDVSVVEGAKVDMQITSVTRTGSSLAVVWTATYNGVAVDPCNTTAAVGAPLFLRGTANTTTGESAANLNLLRAYVLGDDWANPGIGTSPGQPNNTGLTTSNTACVNNVATTTLTLTGAEATATGKAVVALQGKAQVKLPYTYDSPLTPAVEAKDVIQVRSKTPTKEYMIDNSAVTSFRRPIVETANCLGCHVGSLYQHGGNRIDNVDMCVLCHNEASSEQSVRVFDGVDATEAFDGKVGQTYGFKSLLHAVHSAGNNDAVTMIYRTNGNFVWAKDRTQIQNYPQFDVFADGNTGKISSVTPDDDPLKTAPVGTGGAALMFGSSAPHGTGPATELVGGVQYYQVYRSANLHVTHYPKALNDCASCHKANTFGFPDASKAIATTVNVGSVAPTQASATHANYANLNDDTVQGASATACMSCHATATTTATGKTKAWLSNHANGGGFAPAVINRTSILSGTVKENCTSCHK